MIPKILHFCFGLSRLGGDWGLVHYACVKSAIERIKPQKAFLYFEYPPFGPFWNLTTKIVTCQKVRAPRMIFGNRLNHYAHRADVLRLEKLISVGGIYLDCDVFVHRGMDELLDHSVVLGQQGEGEDSGLCNAVILAEPNAPFLRRWYSEYKSFRSRGQDRFWCEHSVAIPRRLARSHGDELTILDSRAFFWPTWDEAGLRRIYESNEPIPSEGAYANHLWENLAWLPYLRDLTPAHVRMVDSNFHRWVRPLITDLPDDFGARPILKRIGSGVVASIGSGQIRLQARSFLWRSEQKLRRAITFFRARSAVFDRVMTNRRRYLDKVVMRIAQSATKATGSYTNFAVHLHRRRTFQSAYRDHQWGADSSSLFFSGFGSRGIHAERYVDAIVPLLLQHAKETTEEMILVDLGCGDFAIAAALLRSLKRGLYIGCDIVPELVSYNESRYGTRSVQFRKIDIVRDALPTGHVCLIRQVFQHLSNADISLCLPKLGNYKHVYVSEAQPLVREGTPNPDKPVGAGVRFDWRTGRGRGVELDLPPWNLNLEEILRSNSTGAVNESIITYRIISTTSPPRQQELAKTACGIAV